MKYQSTAYRNDYTCSMCGKPLLNTHAEYAKYLFGIVCCKACSPEKTLRGADNPFKEKQRPQAEVEAEKQFLDENSLADIPF